MDVDLCYLEINIVKCYQYRAYSNNSVSAMQCFWIEVQCKKVKKDSSGLSLVLLLREKQAK